MRAKNEATAESRTPIQAGPGSEDAAESAFDFKYMGSSFAGGGCEWRPRADPDGDSELGVWADQRLTLYGGARGCPSAAKGPLMDSWYVVSSMVGMLA